MARKHPQRRANGPPKQPPSDSGGGASQPTKRPSGGGGGRKKKNSAWADPTPAEIETQIRESWLPLTVSLVASATSSCETIVDRVVIPVVACGVHSTIELVELQQLLGHGLSQPVPTRTPQENSRDTLMTAKDHEASGANLINVESTVWDVTTSKWTLRLTPSGSDALWRFVNGLVLRVQSLGLPVRPLLPTGRVIDIVNVDGCSSTIADSPSTPSVVGLIWRDVLLQRESSILQHVQLPPPPARTTDLSSLYNPQLVPMVDAMLAEQRTTGRTQVVILRGIPGSGKSTLGRELAAIGHARGVRVLICSADTYFETPRGYVFDVKGLSAAHEASQRRFREAIHGSIPTAPLVIVDNTHTQRWEYEVYEQAAIEKGCKVHVLEMHCPDVLTSLRMARRNSHGVGALKVLTMFLRWEADARATLFTPHFVRAVPRPNPITRNPFKNHVAYVGLFLDKATRAQLLNRFPPRHQQVIAEHITLFYRPTTQYVRQAPIGRRYTFKVTHLVEDARGQTLQVALNERLHLRVHNKIPHITLSTAESVSAYYSNDLLGDPEAKRTVVKDNVEFEAQLGFVLMAQNHKKIVIKPPFEDDLRRSASAVQREIVVLCLTEKELSSPQNAIAQLQWHGLTEHHFGSNSHRLALVSLSPDSTLSRERAVSMFEEFMTLPGDVKVAPFHDLRLVQAETSECGDVLAGGSWRRLTVLSSGQTERLVAQLLNGANTKGLDTAQHICTFNHTVGATVTPEVCSSLTQSLDAVVLSAMELATNVVAEGVSFVGESLQSALPTQPHAVERCDTSVNALCASTIDLVSTSGLPTSDLVASFKSQGIANSTSSPGCSVVYFQLPSKQPWTPVFRVYTGNVATHRSIVAARQRVIVRDTLDLQNQERFVRVLCVVRAVLLRELGIREGVSEIVSAITFLCEEAVCAFLEERQRESTSPADMSNVDHKLEWRIIVDFISTLKSTSADDWAARLTPFLGKDGRVAKLGNLLERAVSSIAASVTVTLHSLDAPAPDYLHLVLDVCARRSTLQHRRYYLEVPTDHRHPVATQQMSDVINAMFSRSPSGQWAVAAPSRGLCGIVEVVTMQDEGEIFDECIQSQLLELGISQIPLMG